MSAAYGGTRDSMLSTLARSLRLDSKTTDADASEGLGWEAISEVAMKVYSTHKDDDIAMTMLGVKCMDEGLYEQAEFFLSSALQADPACLLAKENRRILFDRMVHRWHFHMLNDVQRNSAYFKAIHLAIQSTPNCTVLDVGSGTGLLSMMAVRSAASQVFAIEVNSTMVAMARDILAANEMADKVHLLHSLSTSLSVPRNIPERVHLVVTEIVDAGLLGEHIVPTLRHAWKELLLAPESGGMVIPCGATVYAVCIESPEIRNRSKLSVSEVAGVSLQSVSLEGSCCKAKDGKGLERESYTCERLNHLRGGTRYLTSAQPVLQFDFSKPEVFLPEANTYRLAVSGEGRLDAVAVWFDLHLSPDVHFSTSPSWELSWEQAIFPVAEDMTVQVGDTVLLHAACSDTSLSMRVEKESGLLTPWEGPVFYVERSDLLRLNDHTYTGAYQQALKRALVAMREGDSDEDSDLEESSGLANCVLLDMCEGLSVLGLAAAMLGADFVLGTRTSPVYRPLLEHLAAAHGVTDCVSLLYQDVDQCPSQLVWDVVVCDIISPQGTIHEGIFEKLAHLRSTKSCPSSLFIPSSLRIEVILIDSPSLRAQSSVLGTVPTLGLEVAPFINHYQVTHFVDLDLGAFPVQLLSKPFKLVEVDLNSLQQEPLQVNIREEVEVVANGNITGLAYWFTFNLIDDITVTSAPRSYEDSHWHQCVFMLPEDMSVHKGDSVTVVGALKDSCIDISLAT